MVNLDEMLELAIKSGFTNVGKVNMDAIVFMPEIRQMCSADRCHAYGRNWRCPPACGTIEEATEVASHYTQGILVQFVGELEDEYDYEGITMAGAKHKECFVNLVVELRSMGYDILPMSSGTCSICEKCAYPDNPCRFPEKSFSSMEAYGLWVSKVCEMSNVLYNYGKNKIAYTGCILFK